MISRPNTGIVGALNETWGLARADLVARMDADDVALPVRFERQVHSIWTSIPNASWSAAA